MYLDAEILLAELDRRLKARIPADDIIGISLLLGDQIAEEGHELNCWAFYYENCRSYTCAESETGKHRFEKQSGCALYICKYCGTTATVN